MNRQAPHDQGAIATMTDTRAMMSNARRRFWVLVVLALFLAGPAIAQEASPMKIRFTIDGKTIDATLLDNETARDFLSLLPTTLTLEDYVATEKIAYLPKKLSTSGAPPGVDPSIGDITYYAPWGNLAIFYKDFGYANGLIKLGRLESGIELLGARGDVEVMIEPVPE